MNGPGGAAAAAPARWRGPAVVLALALACVAAVGAWRFGAAEDPVHPLRAGFAPAQVPAARALLARVLDGLAGLQEADGGFALERPEDRPVPPEPEVKRTAASALAGWALALGEGRAAASGRARAALARTRAHLVARQQGDGTLGRMPPNALGRVEREAEVTALCAGVLAALGSAEVPDRLLVGRASQALPPVLGGLRDGWQRGLAAITLEALVQHGRTGGLGPDPRRLMAEGEVRREPDCGDYRLAEALVRRLRSGDGAPDPYPGTVLAACLGREPLAYGGQTSDLRSWLLQACLVLGRPEARAWFAAALPALEEAVGAEGTVGAGLYADRVSQTACAALVLGYGLMTQVVD